MYTTLIVWLIIVLVVIIVVLLSKNNIARLLILALIIGVFFGTFSQFLNSINNTKLETDFSIKFEKKFDALNLNQYKKKENGKIEYKGKEYSIEEIGKLLKLPPWMKPDVSSVETEETLSKMLAKNSARAVILGIYFLAISIVVNVLFQIGYIIIKRKKIKK